MAINQELLARIEASADDWGPNGKYGNDEATTRGGKEDDGLNDRLGLHPISIRFPKELVRDLKAIAHINDMGYQPLIREVLKRFVDNEKRAILADAARRRKEQAEKQRALTEATEAAQAAEKEAEASEEERKAA